MEMTVTTIVVSFSRHQLLVFKSSSERDTTVTTAYADTASNMITQMLTNARRDIIRQLKVIKEHKQNQLIGSHCLDTGPLSMGDNVLKSATVAQYELNLSSNFGSRTNGSLAMLSFTISRGFTRWDANLLIHQVLKFIPFCSNRS